LRKPYLIIALLSLLLLVPTITYSLGVQIGYTEKPVLNYGFDNVCTYTYKYVYGDLYGNMYVKEKTIKVPCGWEGINNEDNIFGVNDAFISLISNVDSIEVIDDALMVSLRPKSMVLLFSPLSEELQLSEAYLYALVKPEINTEVKMINDSVEYTQIGIGFLVKYRDNYYIVLKTNVNIVGYGINNAFLLKKEVEIDGNTYRGINKQVPIIPIISPGTHIYINTVPIFNYEQGKWNKIAITPKDVIYTLKWFKDLTFVKGEEEYVLEFNDKVLKESKVIGAVIVLSSTYQGKILIKEIKVLNVQNTMLASTIAPH